MLERLSFERELAELGAREFQVAPPGNDPTVGFEFDVHYGLIKTVIEDAGLTMPADGLLARKPNGIAWDEAAPLCDGALTSLSFLEHVAGLREGQRLLVNGASGGLGTAAIQIGRLLGAHVTGVCSSANVELVRSLGAHEVIDYTHENFTRSDRRWHVVYDTVGKSSFARAKRVLTDDGVYMSPVLGLPLLLNMLWSGRLGGPTAKFSATGLRPVEELQPLLDRLTAWLESGELRTVIERRYPLARAAEAHRHVDGGHKRGNVVLLPTDG